MHIVTQIAYSCVSTCASILRRCVLFFWLHNKLWSWIALLSDTASCAATPPPALYRASSVLTLPNARSWTLSPQTTTSPPSPDSKPHQAHSSAPEETRASRRRGLSGDPY